MATTNIKKLVYPYNEGADQAIADFTNIPTLNGNNAFTGSNTFTALVKVDSGDSWETINNNDFITKAEVNLELDQIKQDITAIEQGGVSAATTEKAGIVELATPQEVTSGTANKVVTANNLKTVTDAINTSITNITNGTTSITLPDASTTQKGVVELADADEISAGTATDKVVTVKDVMDMITTQIKAQDVHHVVDSIEDIPDGSPDGVYIVTGA